MAALAWLLFLSPSAAPRGGAAAPGLAAPAPATTGGASGALARLAAGAPRRPVEVIIQLRRGVDLARGRALVRSLGGQPGIDLHIINGLSARLSAGAAWRLAASPLVHAVSLNAALKESVLGPSPGLLATTFDWTVSATKLWGVSTGAGVGVAVIDTGISGDLQDFQTAQGSGSSRVTGSAVIDPNATTADDTYGHGTAVAGLIAGNGDYRNSSSDQLFGGYAGTAPNANLISVKVADDNGQATTLDAIYGLQFVVDHQADYNIRVVNLSFRSTSAESYTTDPLDAAVEAAWFHGITVVAAAGNLGTAPDAVDYAPGNDPYAITVGAVDENGTRSTSNDVEASWSSQGTTQDGLTKPDVLAPGAHIATTLAPNSAFATLCPSCVIGGSYIQLSGTSLAAPIVAGVAADLIAAHPDWTPDMVKGAIVNTAVSLSSGGNLIDAMTADSASGNQLVSNQNLTPNGLIDPSTGGINYSAGSWSAGSWSAGSWSAGSWSADLGASWTCGNCSSGSGNDVAPTAGSWSAGSWSTVGWATYWG